MTLYWVKPANNTYYKIIIFKIIVLPYIYAFFIIFIKNTSIYSAIYSINIICICFKFFYKECSYKICRSNNMITCSIMSKLTKYISFWRPYIAPHSYKFILSSKYKLIKSDYPKHFSPVAYKSICINVLNQLMYFSKI